MITIERLDDSAILVNGKEVRKDMNGNWVAKGMNMTEAEACNFFITAMDRTNGKLVKATFKK